MYPRSTPEDLDLCDYDEDGRPQTRRGHIRDAVFTLLRGLGFLGLFALSYGFIVLAFSI
jgi:hypothetical protein